MKRIKCIMIMMNNIPVVKRCSDVFGYKIRPHSLVFTNGKLKCTAADYCCTRQPQHCCSTRHKRTIHLENTIYIVNGKWLLLATNRRLRRANSFINLPLQYYRQGECGEGQLQYGQAVCRGSVHTVYSMYGCGVWIVSLLVVSAYIWNTNSFMTQSFSLDIVHA